MKFSLAYFLAFSIPLFNSHLQAQDTKNWEIFQFYDLQSNGVFLNQETIRAGKLVVETNKDRVFSDNEFDQIIFIKSGNASFTANDN